MVRPVKRGACVPFIPRTDWSAGRGPPLAGPASVVVGVEPRGVAADFGGVKRRPWGARVELREQTTSAHAVKQVSRRAGRGLSPRMARRAVPVGPRRVRPALSPRAGGRRCRSGGRRASRSVKTPSRRTPITFMLREDLPWLLQAHRGAVAPAEPTDGCGREVLHALRGHGALFQSDLQTVMGRLPTEVEEGLWDGVARGLITRRRIQRHPVAPARPHPVRPPPAAPSPSRFARPSRHMAAGDGGPLDAAARRPADRRP